MLEKQNSHKEETFDSGLMDGINYTGNKGPFFGTRHVIIIMAAFGSSFSLATRIVFTVVLDAMTTKNTSSNTDIPTYEWTNKGVLISSVMWLGIPVQVIAGPIVQKYGHKWFYMGSVIVNAIFFMLIPTFASFGGSVGVIVCRLIEGVATGVMVPIGGCISGLWIPAEERSKLSMISAGIGVLFAIISNVGALQIAPSSIGYPGVCYIIGGLNFLWCIGWYFLGYQSPATHPRISPEERKYIETSLNSRKTKHIPTPWLKLLSSIHFWAPVVAAIGVCWIDTLMGSVNLLFMTKAWRLDMQNDGLIIGVAPVIGLVFGIFFAPLSDFLIRRKYLRRVNARRLFHTVGIVGNSLALLAMTWIPAGASKILIMANLFITNIFTIMFSIAGSGINMLDIAPSFAGVIAGFSSTLSQCFGLIAPLTHDWIVKDEHDFSQWRIVYLIAGIIATGTAIFFDIFATDKRRWENIEEESQKN